MHPFEYEKPTNTGRIIQDCLPKTKIILWERTNPAEDLLDIVQESKNHVFLVFPKEYKTDNNIIVNSTQLPISDPHFILLDGTWKQARKIFRKSPYLHHLPIISFNSEQKSIYHLRNPTKNHHLCTIEVAVILLRLNLETEQSEQLNDYFRKFVNQYMSYRTGKYFSA